MPFDDDDDKKPGPQKPGLKIDNANSMFANMPKKPSQQDFERKVQESQKRSRDYKERAAELALNFKKMLDDKTVPQNKPIFANELERDTLGKFAQLAIDMNLDDQEEEGMGSVGLITLLFRCLLIQRDKINVLDYSVNQLEKQLKSIQSPPVDTNKPSE